MEKPVGLVEGPPRPTVLGTERQPFPVPLSCGTRLPTPLVFLRRSRIKVPPPPPLPCGGGTGAREPPPFPRPLSCGRGGRRPRFAGCHFTRKAGIGRCRGCGCRVVENVCSGIGVGGAFGPFRYPRSRLRLAPRVVFGGSGVFGLPSDRLFLHKALSAWDFDTPCASFGSLRLTFRAPRNPSGPSF